MADYLIRKIVHIEGELWDELCSLVNDDYPDTDLEYTKSDPWFQYHIKNCAKMLVDLNGTYEDIPQDAYREIFYEDYFLVLKNLRRLGYNIDEADDSDLTDE